ncbi:ClpP/crotonase-like domain protein [Vibrio phage 2.275.O._10N.286.54.E11]|nr:ClpP/crotonase-like domain protein [Vibrio phage 2.275.O._10N.286.54.E11]
MLIVTGLCTVGLMSIVGYAVFKDYIDTTQYDISEAMGASNVYVDGNVIVIDGILDEFTLPQVKNVFYDNIKTNNINTLSIKSNGGSVNAGLEIADFVHQHQLNTFAPKDCHSACTLVFTAGIKKTITFDTVMGFHAPGWQFKEKSYSKDTVGEFVATVNDYAGKMMKHYIDSGMSTSFVASMFSTPFEEIEYYNATELLKNKVANSIQ